MDILSHGLWGATILRERRFVWWAFLSGMAPDLLGSGGAFVYLLSIGEFWGTGTWQLLPKWAREVYHFHHGVLGAALYFYILSIFVRSFRLLILPYFLHVLMDALVHTNDSIDRLLYPIALNTGIHGLNWWEHWWIMALSVGGLVFVNVFLWLRKRDTDQ